MLPPRPTAVYDEPPRSLVASLLYGLVFLSGAIVVALAYALPITALLTQRFDDTRDLATSWSLFWNGAAFGLIGLICGVAFLLRFRLEGETPSAAFAIVVPLLALPIHALVVNGLLFRRSGWALADAVLSSIPGYLCLVLFLIPISLPYVMTLRWFHDVVWKWTGIWPLRRQRGALYAAACVWLLFVGEFPRSFDRLRHREAERAMAQFDMKPPGQMTLLRYLAWDDIGYSEESFYRIEGHMTWPALARQFRRRYRSLHRRRPPNRLQTHHRPNRARSRATKLCPLERWRIDDHRPTPPNSNPRLSPTQTRLTSCPRTTQPGMKLPPPQAQRAEIP